MKIGITYDLRKEYLDMGFTEEETAEFDSEETVYAIKDAIQKLSHEVTLIGNIYELVRRLSNGERWNLVFNISEGLYERNREAQVPALLEAYNIPYTFGDPLTLAICLDKAMAKSVVRDAGITTPDFFVVSSIEDSDLNSFTRNAMFPLFVKPAAEGTGKGINTESIVHDADELNRQCIKLLKKYNQPVLIEKYLPGREFTIGILGTGKTARVIGLIEVKLLKNAEPLVYSFMNKELCEKRVKYIQLRDKRIIKEASDIALNAYRALGCRDAGRVDIRADKDGKLYFLEMNPLSGLHPTHSDLPILCGKAGISYKELISQIISSAVTRRKPNKKEEHFSNIPIFN